jgi:hypothetical protein
MPVPGSSETKLGRDEVWSYLRLAALAGGGDQTGSTIPAASVRRTGGAATPSRTNADTQQPVSAPASRGRRRLPFNGRLADAGPPARSKQAPVPGTKAAPRRGGGGAGRGRGS